MMPHRTNGYHASAHTGGSALIEKFSSQFRVQRDETGDRIIRVRGGGHAYEYAADQLGVRLESGKPKLSLRALRRRWPTIRLVQCGDREFTICLPVTDFETACRFLL